MLGNGGTSTSPESLLHLSNLRLNGAATCARIFSTRRRTRRLVALRCAPTRLRPVQLAPGRRVCPVTATAATIPLLRHACPQPIPDGRASRCAEAASHTPRESPWPRHDPSRTRAASGSAGCNTQRNPAGCQTTDGYRQTGRRRFRMHQPT